MRHEGAGQLVIEIVAICDQDNGRILEFLGKLELAYEKEHGQRLARALRMPNHAAAPPAPCTCGVDSRGQRLPHRMELVIAR